MDHLLLKVTLLAMLATLAGCATYSLPPPQPKFDEAYWRELTQGLKQVEKGKQQ